MRCCHILCVLLLGGCHTPSPDFRGITPTRVTVSGATFHIRQHGLRAEAIRLNPQYAPRMGGMRHRMARAMAQVTGCSVAEIEGDQAWAIGRLDCGTGAPPPRAKPREVACTPVRGTEVTGIDTIWVDLDCDLL